MTLPIDLLSPLASRVRTDVHWKKRKNGPFMVREPLTEWELTTHMQGTIPKGVCPIKAGESTTRVAVLDLDSHKGETSWVGMCTVADTLLQGLATAGIHAVPFSSSGGRGIHLYMVWGAHQDAYSVREILRSTLKINGLEEGTGGVAKGQIEIYPKQDSVPVDGFGSMFILPYSGESVPLEPMADYQRMPRDYPVQWPVSRPVPVVQKPEPVERGEPQGVSERLLSAVLTIDQNVPYTEWVKVGQAIHHETEGGFNGLSLWNRWSIGGTDYPGFEELEAKWETFGRSSTTPVTAGTIYKMATEAGWVDVPTADDFEDLPADEHTGVPNVLRFAVQNALSFASGATYAYLIKGVLPEADLAMIVGDSGSGKSFFTLDMVCSIARGIPWRGRRVTKGRVVYVIAEGSGGFRNRIQAYASHHDLTELDLGVVSAAPNFLEKKDIRDLIASVKAGGACSLIVVDTVAQVTPGSNENSGEDMGRMLANCRALREATGAMVLLVHHTGKDASKGARGWSGFRGNADCLITIERDADNRTATVSKLKDGDDGIQFGFKLVSVPVGLDTDGDPVSSCVVEEAEVSTVGGGANRRPKMRENEQLLLDTVQDLFVRDNEWPTIDFLITEALERQPESTTKMSSRRSNLRRALDGMIDRGILAVENGFISVPEE